MRAKIASVASFCAFIQAATSGSLMSSMNRNGLTTVVPWKVSVTGRAAGGGGTSTPPNDAARTGAAATSAAARARSGRKGVMVRILGGKA